MDILVNVANQKLRIATNLKNLISGTQEFVKFVFNLNGDWDNLMTFAQFTQNGKSYNQYLDDENSVYLPSEIGVGTCTLMLYGSNDKIIATTNYLTLDIDDNILVKDANSTEISQSLYTQLVTKIKASQKDVDNLTLKVTELENNEVVEKLIKEAVTNEMNKYLTNGALANMTIANGSITRDKVDSNFENTLAKADTAMQPSIYDPQNLKVDIFSYAQSRADIVKKDLDTVKTELQDGYKLTDTLVYTKIGDAIRGAVTLSKIYAQALLADYKAFTIKVVDKLPIVGEPMIFYLVPNKTRTGYDKYWWITDDVGDSKWDMFGCSTSLADIESLKSGKLDKTDFNTYKIATDKAIADNAESIKANTTAIDKCATDLSVSSTGYYNLHCDFKIGSIDKATGEEKDGSAFITNKLDLSQYSNVTITTDRTTLYASVFEYDSNSNFKKIVADTKNQITFSPVAGYKYIIWLWYGGTDFTKIAEAHIKGKSINTIAENDTRYELARETCKLDLPDAFYIQKGGTLELFKYGMYYSNYEFVENKYNVRLVNMSGYVTEYSDKIVIKCPTDYTDETLRKPNDLPLFQLLDRFGKVIDSKRVKIYVADVAKVTDKTRRIMYLGDSFTGMAIRSGETANLISQTTLTDTKLIGRSIGQGSGNKFTGTGGYSWANYTENPNTLPSTYPNNYLWVDSYNNISMSHFVKNVLNETQLDYLVVLLGWNDYENGAFASKFNWSDLKMRAKKLIENTHAGFPNCKIILESYHYMYPYKRKSYGNAIPQVRQNKYIYDLNKLYQEIANGYDYVTFVQMSCQIDVLHNMTMESTRVNKRSVKTVEYCKDCVHPANEGFYQYSDAEFTTLTYLMSKEN